MSEENAKNGNEDNLDQSDAGFEVSMKLHKEVDWDKWEKEHDPITLVKLAKDVRALLSELRSQNKTPDKITKRRMKKLGYRIRKKLEEQEILQNSGDLEGENEIDEVDDPDAAWDVFCDTLRENNLTEDGAFKNFGVEPIQHKKYSSIKDITKGPVHIQHKKYSSIKNIKKCLNRIDDRTLSYSSMAKVIYNKDTWFENHGLKESTIGKYLGKEYEYNGDIISLKYKMK